MIVDGIVASIVGSSDKGVGFKVMCMELGDTFRCFIPKDRVHGEQLLQMGNRVKVDLNKFFPTGNEIRMDVKNVTLDTKFVEKK